MPKKGNCKICGEETDAYWKMLCFKHWKEENKIVISARKKPEEKPFITPPKKYTTYSAHGHYGTNNPVFAILNYLAMLPAYILGMAITGVAGILVLIGKLFGLKDDFKK